VRRDPGDDLRRKIQPVQRSQGPLVILRNLASRKHRIAGTREFHEVLIRHMSGVRLVGI